MIPESLLNTAPSLPLHRVCMLNGATPEHLLSLVRVGQAHWLRKWLRRIAVAMAARSLGSERFESLSAHSTAIPANPLTQTHHRGRISRLDLADHATKLRLIEVGPEDLSEAFGGA